MSLHRRNNVHNLLVFFILLIIADILLISGQTFKQSRFVLPERYDNKFSDEAYTTLIDTYKPVQLGPGSPDMLPPPFLRYALSNFSLSLDSKVHQYLPYQGLLELREEIAGMYSTLMNRTLDPTKNVIVTVGATEAMYMALLVHTLPGDEWILIEPAFDTYFFQVKMTGGIVRPVRLKSRCTQGNINSADLVLDREELRKAFNPRTKGIIVNNPHNPTGKIFTKEELLFIARLAKKWNALIISDEVYEWTAFDSNKVTRIATLGEDTFSRTIVLSSMSKTYFATGLRIGWAIGPSDLIGNMSPQQGFLTYSLNSYTQFAAAEGIRKMRSELGHPNSYFSQLPKSLEPKRNFVLDLLNRIGMEYIVPQSGFYIFANWTSLMPKATGLDRETGDFKDVKFIKWLIKNVGVTAADGSSFYSDKHKHIGENYVRFCFVKKSETLQKVSNLLLRRFG